MTREPVLDGDVLDDAALELLTDPETDLDSLTDPETDLDSLVEAKTDLDSLLETEGVFESVRSVDTEADTLRLPVELVVSDGSLLADAVVEGVKLGDTGLFVTEGVTEGDGMIA